MNSGGTRETAVPVLSSEPAPGVLAITLNRPHVRNAVDLAMAEGVAGVLDELDADERLRAGVIHGAGSAFCVGMDLKAFAQTGQKPRAGDRGFGGIVRRTSQKPLVAAVEGYALAGGLEIALACDLMVVSRSATLGLPEVKRGLVPAGGAMLRLPRRIPEAIATELILTGESITGERAFELGLANRVVDPGSALEHAVQIAATIARNAPLALRAAAEVLARHRDWPSGEFWIQQAGITEPVLDSEDGREGARAFVERRPPVWRGE